MRWLLCCAVLSGCAGTGDPAPDAEFKVTVTNLADDCAPNDDLDDALSAIWPLEDGDTPDFCACSDTPQLDGGRTDCKVTDSSADGGAREQFKRSSETFTYGLFRDGDSASLRIDGEDFASGTLLGCDLEYESPVWLDTRDGGDVQWQVSSINVLVDPNGGCKADFQGSASNFDFLGVEEIEVVGSDNDDYPLGRKVWKIISGKRTSG
jgi:hypothetical protein